MRARKSRGVRLGLVRLIGAFFMVVAPSFAQPAKDSPYDLSSTIEVRGVLTQFWLEKRGSPDSGFEIRATDKDGRTQQWTVILGRANDIIRSGVTLKLFAGGESLVVVGNPSLEPNDHRMLAKTITRSDGSSAWTR
jgi:Family of unknown function (DUF6152)